MSNKKCTKKLLKHIFSEDFRTSVLQNTEAYLEPSQTSAIDLFCKNS